MPDKPLTNAETGTPLAQELRRFAQRPAVLRFVSISCFCAAFPFGGVAAFWYVTNKPLLAWCNIFWTLFLLGASFAVRRFGIQRVLALALLLVALMFLGTGAVWGQLGDWILAAFNFFWTVVFLFAAFALNPRRNPRGNPVDDEISEKQNQQ